MITLAKIIKFTRQLYPTGMAFRLPVGSNFYNLHAGLGVSEVDAVNAATAVLDQILPDNDNFTEADATAWETKLQIPFPTSGTSLEDRKAAILRKMRHPGDILPRQSAEYIQNQLITAGFTGLIVIQNKFSGVVDPIAFTGGLYTEHGAGTLHGDTTEHGAINDTVADGVVISQLKQEDEIIQTQTSISYRASFIICANPYPSKVNIPASREREFRELICKIKPAHMAAYLFVNYTT